ncbi:hypothetical protein [Legionella maioricensis]|uniref:Uncharacterized protein n=1 Tax=Legionella maioricensis TaxID=2896528 RepID=A0A9X2CZA2_9GAMM|nr:hypothetical protein [Legionella maioricensis]MCL9683067.1 hypothetical protein [Legionella maioricensis]MCL9686415.1 hypothetical protein [Legionella maioricensis]
MSCYLFFKRSRWVILSSLLWLAACGGDNAPKVDDPGPAPAANAQNQANVGQVNNGMNAAVQPQATLEVSTCGQTTSLMLPH